MAEGGSMNHPTASSMVEAASEEGGENDHPIEITIAYLKDVEECTKAVEQMSSRYFNNEQCDYLKDKLKLVFQSASSYFKEVLRGMGDSSLSYKDIERYRGSRSSLDCKRRVEVFWFLLALAEQIESFVRGCCEDTWIRSAMTLANVPEYVSSLGFNLELCKAACSKQGGSASLRLVDVHGIFEAEFQTVKVKASKDLAILRSKLLGLHTLSGDDDILRFHLNTRLSRMQTGSAIPSPSSTPNESKLQSTTGNATAIPRFIWRNLKAIFVEPKVIIRTSSSVVEVVKWLGMTVAEKTFVGAGDEEFKKEVQILQRLCHPNVITFFSSTTNKSNCSISMELMDSDLYRLIEELKKVDKILQSTKSCTPFSLMEAVDLMLQVGQGVEYLHDQEPIIVHLDLKSPNVLIRSIQPREESERGIKAEDSKIVKREDFRRYFQVKVTDFGLSETKANSICSSDQRYNVGTSRWMPPETVESHVGGQEKMAKKAPKKSDVYSFAMVCYEILTGNLPFPGVDNAQAKKNAKLRLRPDLPEHCPLRLKLLIERCWSHDPQDRPHFDFICKELRYLKYLLMTDTVVYDRSTYVNGLFTYGGDFLVDRPIARFHEQSNDTEQPYKTMMDRVRHRLEPFPAISSTTDDFFGDSDDNNDYFSADSDDFFGDSDDNNDYFSAASDDPPRDHDTSLGFSQLETLVELLIRSDVIVQIALFQTLLEERSAIPIVVPYNEDFNDFRHLLEALSYVRVKIQNEEILSIAANVSLPRVVFVSNRRIVSRRESGDMARVVMNCQFPSKDLKKDTVGVPTLLELGVGFLKSSTKLQVLHRHCLAFCVTGDHNKLGMVLQKFADVVIIEIDPKTKPAFPSWIEGAKRKIHTLFWSIDSEEDGKSKKLPAHLWGNFNYLSIRITRDVLATKRFRGKDDEESLSLPECFHLLDPLHRRTSVIELEAIDFDKVRDSLTLQKNYNEEASYYFLSLRERRRSTELKSKMQDCQEYRKKNSKVILELPILKLFVQILSEEDRTKRGMSILHLQCFIDQKLKTKLEEASKKVTVAFEKLQGNRKVVTLKKDYEDAMAAHVNQMLGLEHLWRELSHIFVASPEKRLIPSLAARHLLDGFPLEILDGDAAHFNREWVDTVLIELNVHLKASLKREPELEPKVFVLSVIGIQSSGKSTLLNTMFGTKLKTSAGMCTRGVYLQLVKSEWPKFDYVLILDTEGLRAPEHFSRENSPVQDNRLATFALLPADACVVMVANEDDNGLKEVLPMVMLAFKGSKVAELRGGMIQAKLFFVYRGIDVNDKAKLGKNQQKLGEYLETSASAIENFKISETSNQGENAVSDAISPLSTFRIDSVEQFSDVKFFGNLKRGAKPPDDTPDWEYGSKVEELREYIHDRVLENRDWNSHGLLTWMNYLDKVWLSIADANFELSFTSHIEHDNYHVLQTHITKSRLKVGRECQEKFEDLMRELVKGGNIDQQEFDSRSSHFKVRLERTIEVETTKVSDFLSQVRFQRWKTEEAIKWTTEGEVIKTQWLDNLKSYFHGTLRFDNIVRDYITDIQLKISDPQRSWFKEYSPERASKLEDDFKGLFDRFVEDAEKKFPPSAPTIRNRVFEFYSEDAWVISQKFDFNGEVESTSNIQNFVWVNTEAIIESWKKSFGSIYSVKAVELQELIKIVAAELQDVKQYSKHIVENIILSTSTVIGNTRMRNEQILMHKFVRELVVIKLTKLQGEWDSHHNVATRLKAYRGFLKQSFLNHADEVDKTKMLSMALCEVLGADNLLGAFKVLITKYVSTTLQTREEWVCDWKVLRAHLDLHLIELIKSKQTQELLNLVSDGAGHYKLVVEKFIKEEIDKQLEDEVWPHFTTSICHAIERAATAASDPDSGGSKPVIFQQKIIQHLNDLSDVLARGVSITLSTKVCSKYTGNIDFKQIHEDVSASVKKILLNKTKFPTSEVIEMVRRRLIDANTASARARCDVMCPHCRLTCFKPMDHSGLHNTLHQPQGLCNWHGRVSKELVQTSCSKSVELEHRFYVNPDDKEAVPYKEWTRIYPKWVLPSEGMGSVEVREYIFANFQKELVQKYSGSKECLDIPVEYMQHSLDTLQLNLVNVVRSGQHHT